MEETIAALLEQQPFVQPFEQTQVEELASLARLVRFGENHVIFPEGDTAPEFYLILSGDVALEIAPPDQAFRIDTLSAGDELGWSAVLGKGKVFQARTLRPVAALAFDGDALRGLCERDTAFGYVLMRRLLDVVSERLQAARLQVLDMYWPVAKRAGA